MSTEIDRKLAILCCQFNVTPEQFIDEFSRANPSVRRAHLREWMAGTRRPHGRSIDRLTTYWGRYCETTRRFWWSASFEKFKQFLEQEFHGRLPPEINRDAAIPGAIQGSLCGLYAAYRVGFEPRSQVFSDIVSFESEPNHPDRISTTVFTLADDHERSFTKYTGYTYFKNGCLYTALTTAIAEPRSLFLVLSADHLGHEPLLGLMLGMSSLQRAPVAVRIVLARREGAIQARDALCTVRCCSLSELPVEYQEILDQGLVSAAPLSSR